MIDKDDLKEWLKEAERKASIKKIEERLDNAIKFNALRGKYTFYVSTGEHTTNRSVRTSFYDVWYDPELSAESRQIVHDAILEKYKEFGFDIELTSIDCGWSNFYAAIKFNNIDRLVKRAEEAK